MTPRDPNIWAEMSFFEFFFKKQDFFIKKYEPFLQKRGQKLHVFESFLTCECKNGLRKCKFMDPNAKK